MRAVAVFQKELSHRAYIHKVSIPAWQISVLERVTLNYEWLGPLTVYVGGPRCPEFTHRTATK